LWSIAAAPLFTLFRFGAGDRRVEAAGGAYRHTVADARLFPAGEGAIADLVATAIGVALAAGLALSAVPLHAHQRAGGRLLGRVVKVGVRILAVVDLLHIGGVPACGLVHEGALTVEGF
jgi:hypothetical protein